MCQPTVTAGPNMRTTERARDGPRNQERPHRRRATFLDPRGSTTGRGLRVVANRVVVACGALATPALLERSGVARGTQLGRNLHVQPAARVVGVFADEVRAWAEVPQASCLTVRDGDVELRGFAPVAA